MIIRLYKNNRKPIPLNPEWKEMIPNSQQVGARLFSPQASLTVRHWEGCGTRSQMTCKTRFPSVPACFRIGVAQVGNDSSCEAENKDLSDRMLFPFENSKGDIQQMSLGICKISRGVTREGGVFAQPPP